jgi:pimeloyl-ACP methyl ester carboxylesterase
MSETTVRSGYVDANGVRYYYEVHGEGEPLLVLHGGLGSIDVFAPLPPGRAAHRQVIAVDLHGHGRTALGDRPISLVDMGDDMATVLGALGYGQVDVLGYSMGGGARSGWRCSTPSGCAGWCSCRRPSPRTGSTRTSCRSRRRSARRWRS